MTTYGILFRLDVIHDYYSPHQVPVRLEPWGLTRNLLKETDARLIPGGSRIEFACSDDRTTLLSRAEDGLIEAVFALYPDTQDFFYVTAGLKTEAGHVSVFDAVQVWPPLTPPNPPRPASDLVRVLGGGTRPPAAFVRVKIDPKATDAGFELRLAAVELPWTYHVIGGSSDAAMTIRDTAGEVTFTSLGARQTNGGGASIGFRSDKDIQMRARPEQRFELLGESPFGLRVIMPVLPTPRPGPTADVYVNLS